MSIAFFIVGVVIFFIYVFFLIWDIFSQNKKQEEDNNSGYYQRHGMVDNIDMESHTGYKKIVPINKKVNLRSKIKKYD